MLYFRGTRLVPHGKITIYPPLEIPGYAAGRGRRISIGFKRFTGERSEFGGQI